MNKYKILVVDDEVDLCEILQFNLETEGYDVDTAFSAEEALTKDLSQYNLLMLDVMMGEMSGFKMASIVRKNEKLAKIPIMFLTAKDAENDRLTGFTIGADDYISKPFSIREVCARVKVVIRRNNNQDEPALNVVEFEDLNINLAQKKVKLMEEDLQLTKKEFEILKLFLQYPNRVFSREEILSQVWTDEVYVLDRTIDVNITRLRKKIGKYGKNIVTRLGYGYCFETTSQM